MNVLLDNMIYIIVNGLILAEDFCNVRSFFNIKPNKMKPSNMILFSAMVIAIFSSCRLDKSCPGFDEMNMKEFSYQAPDTLIFVNEDSERFEVYIKEINRSESYEYECRDLYRICPCINYVEAVAKDTRTAIPYAFLRMEQSDRSDIQYFKYNIQGFEFEFDFINELPFINEMDMFTHHGSFIVGNKVYYDVVVITNSDDELPRIYQVFFTKKDGIIRFIEKETSMAWNIFN